MAGTYSRVKTWSAGETLTAADLNAEFDNEIINADPDSIGDESADATEMRAITDPYPGSSASLATDLKGEILRLRYQIKAISGESYWYIDPNFSMSLLNDTGAILDVLTGRTLRAVDGILFGSDTAAANTLNDYEIGEYTPTLTCSTSGSYTIDASEKTLAYEKIGDFINIHGRLHVSGESSPSGDLRLSLPLTVANLTEQAGNGYGTMIIYNHGQSLPNLTFGRCAEAGAFALFLNVADDGTLINIDMDDIDSDFYITVGINYRAA
jgi:hypothetical protein